MDMIGRIMSFVLLVLGTFFIVKYVFPVASALAVFIIRLLHMLGGAFSV